MELRYMEDFKVEEAVIHLVSNVQGEPIYSEKSIVDEEILEEFIPKHTLRVLNDFENMKAAFYNEEERTEDNMVNTKIAVDGILDNSESFLENSKIIAKLLSAATRQFEDFPGYAVMISRLTVYNEGERESALSIMKLDFQSGYAHDILFENDEVKVGIVKNENNLPSGSQKVSNCAVIKKFDNSGYRMLVLNKKARDVEGNLVDYFVESFLGAEYVMDDTSKTVKFKGVVEKWIRKAAKDDISKAIDAREVVNKAIGDGLMVDIDDVVYGITDSNDEKESLEEALAVNGILPHDKFQIDKNYIEKRLKTKQIKTNTGFVLKGDRELFHDPSRFEVIFNGDGTVTYVIKSVRNIVER